MTIFRSVKLLKDSPEFRNTAVNVPANVCTRDVAAPVPIQVIP